MPDLISLLVWLIVFCVVGAILLYCVDLFPDPPLSHPFRGLLKALLVLVLLFVFLRHVGVV